MAKHPIGLEAVEQQLWSHDLRLTKLRAWHSAVLAELGRCAAEGGSREKALDTTPASETLLYERDTLAREIRAHEILIALGRDQRILQLLDKVVGDPSLAREAASDPKAFAAAQGIGLPGNLAVEVKVVGDRVTVQVDYVDLACAASLTFP